MGAVSLASCKREVDLSPMLAEALGLRWCLSVAKAIMAAIDPIIQDCCFILNLFEDIKVTAIS